jgi:hypothetical protein
MEAGRACSNRATARLDILVREEAVSEACSKAQPNEMSTTTREYSKKLINTPLDSD